MANTETILKFLHYLNDADNSFILKGGAALSLLYNCPRCSDNVDLDAWPTDADILSFVSAFCSENGHKYNVNKNTATVQCVIIYGNIDTPLRVELSRRLTYKPVSVSLNNIHTYTLDQLFHLKHSALLGRERVRDLFDTLWLYLNFGNLLKDQDVQDFKDTLDRRGSDWYLNLIKTQNDIYVDAEQTKAMFSSVFNLLGL